MVSGIEGWAAELDVLHARIGRRFVRSEPRRRAREYLTGLVAGLERKHGWTLAEHSGKGSPDGMARFLSWADGHVDGLGGDVGEQAVRHLGDPGGLVIVVEGACRA